MVNDGYPLVNEQFANLNMAIYSNYSEFSR